MESETPEPPEDAQAPSAPPPKPVWRRWHGAAVGLLVLLCFLIPGTEAISVAGGVEAGPEAAARIPQGAPTGEGSVQIRVRGPGGEVVEGARVRVLGPGGQLLRRGPTDAEGNLRIDDLPEVAVVVEAHAPGFATAREQVTPAADEPAAVRFALERTSEIAGRVYGPDGKAAAGAQVTIAGSGLWPPKVIATDERGRFRLEAIPAGVYEVHARKGGLVAEPREGLAVASGVPVFVSLRLSPGVALAGVVVDARSGEPIEGADVTVTEDLLSLEPRTVQTDAEGKFRVGGLQPHPHRLTAVADGYVARVAEEVTPGGEPVRLALERAALIAGVVLDALDRPVAGARLEVVGKDVAGRPVRMTGPAFGLRASLEAGAPSQGVATAGDALSVTAGPVPPIPTSALAPASGARATAGSLVAAPAPLDVAFVTDDEGRFRIEGVPPGQVQIIARHPDHAPGITRPRRLVPGQTVDDLTVVMPEGGTIRGRVLDERDFPVARVPVQAHVEGEPAPRFAVAADDGTFAFDGLRGTVVLSALPEGQPVGRTRVEVGGGERQEVTLRVPGRSETLSGRTVDTAGFPVARAQVTVRALRPDAPVERVALSGDDGTFTVTGLPGPPYRLTARHFDYADTRLDRLDAGDAKKGEVRVEMRPGAAVSGQVQDAFDQVPVDGATVRLARGDKTMDETRTGASGKFRFSLVPAGHYEIIAEHPDFASARAEADLAPGPRGLLDLDVGTVALHAGGRVTGTVTDRNGDPVGAAEVAVGRPPDWAHAARAGPEGHFTLEGLPPGAVHIEARHPAAGRAAARGTVVVRVKSTTEGVLVRLPEAYDPERARVGAGVRSGVAATVADRGGRVVVTSVKEDSGAAAAGLAEGDVIDAVDDTPVEDAAQAADLLTGPAGVDAVVDIHRHGAEHRLILPREQYLP